MRAIVCREWGGPEKLTVNDVPPPPLRDGAVRIRVHAAGVNFANILLIAGQYQEKPAFPFIPGAEAAGEVTEIGAGVNGLKVGDRVMALTGLGSFAEQVVVDAQRVLPIPDAMEFASAAAFPVAYGTSHGALEWRAHLQSGECLLVTGAAGGVGLASRTRCGLKTYYGAPCPLPSAIKPPEFSRPHEGCFEPKRHPALNWL